MSLDLVVFIPRRAVLPRVAAWVEAAHSHGFQLSFDPGFNPHEHSGGLPVVCQGVEAAFEYYYDNVADYLHEAGESFTWLERLRFRMKFRAAVALVTHSRADDRFAAVVAAAALAQTTHGLLLDCASGRFVQAAEAGRWVREVAQVPSPESVARRSRITASVHEYIGSIVAELGYVALDRAFKTGGSSGSRWFARSGSVFRNELVEASVSSDQEESFLCISFYGTPFSLESLYTDGFSDRAAGWYLFQVLADVLGKPFEDILPRNIPVDEQFASSAAGRQLRRELEEADRSVFSRLRAELEAAGEWWPDNP